MKIAIVGAGLAGLVSLRYCLSENYCVDVFEQTGQIGGVWTYSDRYGVDDDGIPIHTVMYKDLITNLPKDLMTLNDFPYPDVPPSYLTQPRVLQYFQDYAKYFDLLPRIKFFKQVTKIEPVRKSDWKITIKDLKTKLTETLEYEAVMICNGHYHVPNMPNIPGMEKFKGKQLHSGTYRSPEEFKDKQVLVIGAGSSGIDIARKVKKVAKKVAISFNKISLFKVPEELTKRPFVKELNENTVTYQDNSTEEFDVIIYCTGYLYDFPFLTEQCDIKVENRWIKYLYKNVINVKHPTMGFIGVTWECCVVPVAETQVRFFVASLRKSFDVPNEEEMMKDIYNHLNYIKSIGWTERDMHRLGMEQGRYLDDLTKTGNIEMVPPVINKLYLQIRIDRGNPKIFYKITDDYNFTQELI